MGIIRHLIDRKTLNILDLLLKNQTKYSHLSEISKHSKIPLASTFRIVNQLVSLGIIDVTVIGKMKIYRIAATAETRELGKMLDMELKKHETQ